MSELDKETAKAAMKEALKEWLDHKYAQFGRWSLHGLMAAGLAGGFYLFLKSIGWHN